MSSSDITRGGFTDEDVQFEIGNAVAFVVLGSVPDFDYVSIIKPLSSRVNF